MVPDTRYSIYFRPYYANSIHQILILNNHREVGPCANRCPLDGGTKQMELVNDRLDPLVNRRRLWHLFLHVRIQSSIQSWGLRI